MISSGGNSLGLLVMMVILWTCNAFILWSLLKYVFHLDPDFGSCFKTAISIGFVQVIAFFLVGCAGSIAAGILLATVGWWGFAIGIAAMVCGMFYLWGTWSVTLIVEGFGCSRPQGRWALLCYVILSGLLGTFVRDSFASLGIKKKDPFEQLVSGGGGSGMSLEEAIAKMEEEEGEEGDDTTATSDSDESATATAADEASAPTLPVAAAAPVADAPVSAPVSTQAPAAAPASPWAKKGGSTSAAPATTATSSAAAPAVSASSSAPATAAPAMSDAGAAASADPTAAPTVGDIEAGDTALAEAKVKWSEYDFDASIKAAEKALSHYKKVYISTHEKVVSTEKMIATAKEMRDKAKK